MKKNILVEISSLSDSTLSKSGITNYIQGLLGALLKLDNNNQYTMAGFVGQTEYYSSNNPPLPGKNSKYRAIRIISRQNYIRFLKLKLQLPFDKLVGGKYDIALFTNFVAWPIYSKNTKTITFIHDISFELYPEFVDPGNGRYLRRFVKKTIKDGGHIVTISESSKRDITEFYKVSKSRVSVITPAIDYSRFKRSTEQQVATTKIKYGIAGNYVLFVGNVEPRKNLIRVLQSYSELDEGIRNNYSLVLAGSVGWNDTEINSRIDTLIAKGMPIIKTGFIDSEDLPHIYSGASTFIFPSLYEGFGIPVLEAMACGVPVITSNTSSLPEAAGAAAILVDPLKSHDITAAISKVLIDTSLRKKLINKGHMQCKQYTWEKSAKSMLNLIEEIK